MKTAQVTRFLFSLFLIVFLSGIIAQAFGIEEHIYKIGASFVAIGFVKGLFIQQLPSNYAFDLVISDTTYAGEVASGFIVKAITGAQTIEGGHVYVKDGIKKKFTIPRFQIGNLIQDRKAKPDSADSQGDVNVDGRQLDPQDYMLYFEFNPRDFEDHWQAVNLNPQLLDRDLPPTVESVLIQEVSKYHNNYFDKAIWQAALVGGTAPYNKFDGLIKKSTTDADVIDVPTPVSLTNVNIEAKLKAGYDLIPDALLYDPNLKIFVSFKTAKLWQDYQQAQTYKGADVTSRGVMAYKGIRMVPLASFPNDAYLIAKGTATMESNLWVGMNSTEDNSVQLAKLQANSELYFIKMLFKADTQIGFGEEAVLYKA